MKIPVLLMDRIGNHHQRKNVYLRELAELQDAVAHADPGEKGSLQEKLKSHTARRAEHPHILALEAYRVEKKKHEARIAELNKLPGSEDLPKDVQRLEKMERRAQEDKNFYAPYADLDYEAELAWKSAQVIVDRVPSIILLYRQETELIRQLELRKDELNPDDAKEFMKEHGVFAVDRRKIGKARQTDIRNKKRSGDLSKKAAELELRREKTAMHDDIRAHRMSGPYAALEDELKAIRFRRSKQVKDGTQLIHSDISDLRRSIPEEIEKTRPVIAYLTAPFPGLGQLLNGQLVKAALFFIGFLFVYLIAIPYALGYGNYQGEGIAGLLSLAEGGLRVHRSLFFMIEGIIAIFLLLIAAVVLILNFRDVYGVEKNAILGIRRQNWFETWRSIRLDGFPYLVNLPALILIIFIVLVPIFTMILLSFTNMDPQHQSKFQWIGLTNYQIIAMGTGIAGQAFWRILFWTVLWTILATSLAIFIGFALALMANNERVKGKTFFRTVYILPWAVPAFITIMFFSIMFSPQGILTEILSGIAGRPIQVKTDTTLTRTALILLQGWLGSSYIFLLSTGVLQGIPGDLYEAAEIDGATPWQQTSRITIPLVLFQTAPLLVGQFTFNFNNFSIIYLFNQGGPFNPMVYGNLAGSSDLLISYIYKLTIENQQQAIGAAITLVVSLGLMFFAFLGFRNSKAFKEERL